jgi:glucosyl-3-phosphoglycerate phosphatase
LRALNAVAGRFFIARHGETVFNAAARMQGETLHTPLTRTGFAQAEAMGKALRADLGPRPSIELWASPTGRALQTLAILAEHLELDWHAARTDDRLREIGMGKWGGRTYADIAAEEGEFVDRSTLLFSRRAPGGEWYDGIAARLRDWLGDVSGNADRLVVMHGISSRVLRGLLLRLPDRPECGAPVAEGMPQGSVAAIGDGRERLLHRCTGGERAAPA